MKLNTCKTSKGGYNKRLVVIAGCWHDNQKILKRFARGILGKVCGVVGIHKTE